MQCSGGFGVGVNKGFVWQLGSLHNPFFHRLARGRLERDRSEDIWAPEMLRDRDHLPLVRDAPTASKRGRRQLMLCTLLPAMLVAAFLVASIFTVGHIGQRARAAMRLRGAQRESAMARLMRAEVGDHEGFEVASLTRMRRLRGGTPEEEERRKREGEQEVPMSQWQWNASQILLKMNATQILQRRAELSSSGGSRKRSSEQDAILSPTDSWAEEIAHLAAD